MNQLNKLNAIVRYGNLFRAPRLTGTGIGACDRPYLFYISHHEGVSQDTLSGALLVNKSSVARRLAHLEREGLITRVPDESDRRVLLVWLTDKAKALMPLLREVAKEWNGILTAGFTAEEVDTLTCLLARAFDNAKAAAREVAHEADL